MSLTLVVLLRRTGSESRACLFAGLTIAAAVGGCTPTARPHPEVPVPIAADSARTARLAAPARAAGLRPLVEGVAPGSEREVRIWIDGYLLPWRLARIVLRGNQVEGDFYYHWELPEFYQKGQVRDGDVAPGVMAEELRPQCAGPARVADIAVACRLRSEYEPNWSALLRALEGEELWTLPDPSTLPPDGIFVTDGVGITVELAAPGGYRSYRYGNPHAHSAWPSAANADRILQTIQNAFPPLP